MIGLEGIEVFKRIRDVCDDILKAYESENEKEFEAAMGRFLMLMIELQSTR